MMNRSIADLRIGETGVIKSFTDDLISLKLLEMGCLPNTPVKMCNAAPFGDPVCIKVCGYNLSLRKSEASTIIVE